jgi:hypothetical protein
MTPKAYRIRGFVTGTPVVNARTHTAFISQVGPCIRLYHIRENRGSEDHTGMPEKEVDELVDGVLETSGIVFG